MMWPPAVGSLLLALEDCVMMTDLRRPPADLVMVKVKARDCVVVAASYESYERDYDAQSRTRVICVDAAGGIVDMAARHFSSFCAPIRPRPCSDDP